MRKLTIFSEIAFFLGIVLLAVGVIFMIKSDFGISPVQSSAYALYTAFPKISFGAYNYLIQFVLVSILCLSIRKIKLRYFLSFLSAVFYGFTVDFFEYIMTPITAQSLVMKIVFFGIGFVCIAFAVAFFFRTNIPLMPYDIFVTDLTKNKGYNTNTVKIIFDISALVLGVILSLSFHKRLVGIGIGTVISGLFSGITIKYLGKAMDKFIVFKPLVKRLN
ncbi:MAG: DUF6198 family protein [Christensenellales bacterium]